MRNISRIDVRRRARAAHSVGGARYMNVQRRRARTQLHNTLDTDSRKEGFISSLCRDQEYPSIGIRELVELQGENLRVIAFR